MTLLPLPSGFRWPAARLALLTLGLLSGLEAAAATRPRSPTSRTFIRHFAAAPVGEPLRPADLAFLETAADHSRQEVKLAELGTSQATTVDVRSIAEQLAADQRRLADQIAVVLRSKGGGGEVTETGPDLYNRLVQSAPADFDRLFIQTVGRVHDALVNLFEQAAADARDNEVRALAAASLPLLRDHRNKLADLRKAFD